MKKKPSIAIVLGMGKPEGMHKEPDGDEHEEMEYSDEQKAMAGELIDAMKASDAHGVLQAIHGIYESYMAMEQEEEEEPSTKKAY